MFQRLLGVLTALAIGTFGASVQATSLVAMPLEEIAARADEIVRGEVIAIESAIQSGRVLTRVTLRPSECYVGTGPDPETIEIIVLGGRTPTLATIVHGTATYTVGEEVVVFLSRSDSGHYTSYAMSMSKFSVVEHGGVLEARRQIDLDALVGPVTGTTAVDVFPLDELEAMIHHAVELR